MDSPGKNTGVNFHSLLQRIFLTQGLNWHVLHLNWQVGSLPLEPPVSLFLIKCWPLSPVWLCSLLVSCPWNSPGKNTAVDCHSLLQIIFLIEAKWSEVKWKSLSHVWLFATPWTAARQASLSITNYQSLPKPMSIESVMPSNHLILCRPLLLRSLIFYYFMLLWI